MSVLFTAIFSAASIVWDREFGFLREILVAPVSRASIVVGKCLGGATIATFQGIIFLALAGFADVPYNPVLILTLIGELLLLSFTLTAFGVMMAARIKQFQAFMALTQMLVMPLFFLSGALYPLTGLPAWLSVLTRIDPLTYVVGPMRHAVFSHLDIPPAYHAAPVARHYLAGLAGPDCPVARDRGGHGARHDGDRDRRVPQDGVKKEKKKERRRVATGANHPASHSSALRRGPGTPASVPRRGTRAPANMLHRTPPLRVKSGFPANLRMRSLTGLTRRFPGDL